MCVLLDPQIMKAEAVVVDLLEEPDQPPLILDGRVVIGGDDEEHEQYDRGRRSQHDPTGAHAFLMRKEAHLSIDLAYLNSPVNRMF